MKIFLAFCISLSLYFFVLGKEIHNKRNGPQFVVGQCGSDGGTESIVLGISPDKTTYYVGDFDAVFITKSYEIPVKDFDSNYTDFICPSMLYPMVDIELPWSKK